MMAGEPWSASPAPAEPSHTCGARDRRRKMGEQAEGQCGSKGGRQWPRTSVRGGVALAPERSGQRSSPSTGGRPAAAARSSVGSTPARPQKVVYLMGGKERAAVAQLVRVPEEQRLELCRLSPPLPSHAPVLYAEQRLELAARLGRRQEAARHERIDAHATLPVGLLAATAGAAGAAGGEGSGRGHGREEGSPHRRRVDFAAPRPQAETPPPPSVLVLPSPLCSPLPHRSG